VDHRLTDGRLLHSIKAT